MANNITLLRVLIGFFILIIIKISPLWNLIAILLILITMALDAVDGMAARYFNISTINGSIYDILADRILENTFFIYFATQQFFSVWIPIVVLSRGLVTDAIRTIFLVAGKTAFGDSTLHSRSWTIFLACSKISRGLYNTLKMLTFMSFAALIEKDTLLLKWINGNTLTKLAHWFLGSTIFICILRAIPVVFDACMRQNPNKVNIANLTVK